MVLHSIGKKHLQRFQSPLSGKVETADVATVMMGAALIGQTAALRALLDQGAEANVKDPNDWTPLMETAFAGHVEAAQALLEHGADVNAADRIGWTALMEAASKGRSELVKLLIDYGANVQAKSKTGWTALRATPKGNTEIQKMLKQAGAII